MDSVKRDSDALYREAPKKSALYKRLGEEPPIPQAAHHWPGVIIGGEPLGSPEEFADNPFDLLPAAGNGDRGIGASTSGYGGTDIAPWLDDEAPKPSSVPSPSGTRQPSSSHAESHSVPSRKHSLHNLSHFGTAQSLSKFGRLPSYNTSQQNLAGLTGLTSGNPLANPSAIPALSRHDSETSLNRAEKDIRGRSRNDSQESFSVNGGENNRSRESTAQPARLASAFQAHRTERELSIASSVASSSGEKKRGFSALTGLLKRKPHGSKAEESEATNVKVPSPTARSTSYASTTSKGGGSSPAGSDAVRSSLSGTLRHGHGHDTQDTSRSPKATTSKIPRKTARKASARDLMPLPSQNQVLDPIAQEFNLDTDLDHMEGIVNLSAVNAQSPTFAHGASTSSSGSGSDGRPGAGLAGNLDPALSAIDTSNSSMSGTESGDQRAVVRPATNLPANPFTRQNPFSISLDDGGPLSQASPPSPLNTMNRPSYMNLTNQPRRPSQLRNTSGRPSSEDGAPDRLLVEANSGQGTMFRDPFSLGEIPSTVSDPDVKKQLSPHEYDLNATLPGKDSAIVDPGLMTPQHRRPSQSAAGSELDTAGAAWTAPESWGVEGDGVPAEDSSSEEDIAIGLETDVINEEEDPQITPRCSGPPPFGSKAALRQGSRPGTAGRPSTARPGAGVRSAFAARPGTAGSAHLSAAPHHIRIYGADGSWMTMAFPAATTTHEMLTALASKAHLSKGAMKLYVREQGQDRLLLPSEKPVTIQLRRLMQAGYNESDNLEELGRENFAMLYRFIYQPPVLPVIDPEDESSYDSFELVDLGNRDLQAVPIFLYRHAQAIISLNLSRNPLSDLPLDFIQASVMLRELRMTHMALKRVPNSIRRSESLTRLDISCNRIPDLEHAGLHELSTLVSLKVQNNRLTTLPAKFSELKSLKYLNISNNKFVTFPAVVSKITTLVDLDVSFNEVGELPSGLCQLSMLERLVAVGNSLTTFPESFSKLESLRDLDVRRNALTDLDAVYKLPNLAILQADNNNLVILDAGLGSKVREFAVPHNSITRFNLANLSTVHSAYSLTTLDLSYGKLSTLADDALEQLVNLETLNLNYNQFVRLPSTIPSLRKLRSFSCTDNVLTLLPENIGSMENLQVLNVHNNNLKELPGSIWMCKSLVVLNVSSNLLDSPFEFPEAGLADGVLEATDDPRKNSTTSGSRRVWPLSKSLRKLYLGDNRLTEDIFDCVTLLSGLRVLNLSFNDIYEIPSWTLSKNQALEELYLSGNHLTNLPSEDLERLTNLRVLHLNGNKLQTLPAELGKIRNLLMLDVGSNVLKYNIANWPYDWNWNWNLELRYLNLSGNKRLEIKPSNQHEMMMAGNSRRDLADFSKLTQLRVLGLMDVTLRIPSVPDESEDRRVRTSFSDVNNMAYGISDTLGALDNLSMFDLVVPNFRSKENECLFGMFGRSRPNISGGSVPKYVQEWFMQALTQELDRLQEGEEVPDALRRTFLSLNKTCFEYLSANDGRRKGSLASDATINTLSGQANAFSSTSFLFKSGAAGVVAYLVDKTVYVANAGDILAVVSNAGEAELLSVKHDPIDREETLRIRTAEAWVSPRGLLNDELDISRGFGFYNAIPAVNALPDIITRTLTEADEFIIIGNRGLWDYCSYQTAVDIARTEKDDPMMAAQKLRDFALSYGAEGSTMIMVISVRDLFYPRAARGRQQMAADKESGLADPEGHFNVTKRFNRRRGEEVLGDRTLQRLQQEVEPPTGQVALVFTDIKNSTSLWETNAGMQTAMRLHNSLLRRQLRIIGGYEVKTEGDSFMVSFPTVTSAMLWCFTCQLQLINEDWPREILGCDDGREVLDAFGDRIHRGLSVRMGIHWGTPVWEKDPITRRMDYFGPMVNKAARINASADGGQIMASSDVLKEVQGLYDYLETDEDDEVEQLPSDVGRDITQLRRLGLGVLDMGERKLKGLEVPERLFLVYPKALSGRLEMSTQLRENVEVNSARLYGGEDRVISLDDVKQLVVLCVRLESLSAGKVFGDRQTHMEASPALNDAAIIRQQAARWHAAHTFGPTVSAEMTDEELMAIIESLTTRIENALSTMYLKQVGEFAGVLSALQQMTSTSPGGLLKAISAFGGAMRM